MRSHGAPDCATRGPGAQARAMRDLDTPARATCGLSFMLH
jgi:hypothetical protein